MKPTEELMTEHKAIKVMLSIMDKVAENIKIQANADTDEMEKILDFLKTFADKCHHGKEEKVLFPALVGAGMSGQSGPIAVMLYEHDLGRGYIKGMNSAVEAINAGDKSEFSHLSESIEKYTGLLNLHIRKEETVLFPMADRLLPEKKQNEIIADFDKIEEEVVGHGVHERYHELLHQMREKYLG